MRSKMSVTLHDKLTVRAEAYVTIHDYVTNHPEVCVTMHLVENYSVTIIRDYPWLYDF